MKNEKVSKNFIFWIIFGSFLMVLVVVIAFCLFFRAQNDKKNQELNSGSIVMSYAENDNMFEVTNLVPTTDINGKKNNALESYFDFTVDTSMEDSNEIDYEISIKVDEKNSTASSKNIKVYLEEQKNGAYISAFEPKIYGDTNLKPLYGADNNSMILVQTSVSKDEKKNYRLRLWMDENTPVDPAGIYNFSVKVEVNGKAK